MTKFDNFQFVDTYLAKYMSKYSPVKQQYIFTTIITDQGKLNMHFPLIAHHGHVTFKVFGEKYHHARDYMYEYYNSLYELFLDNDLPLDKICESLNAEVKKLYGKCDIEHSQSIHDFMGFNITIVRKTDFNEENTNYSLEIEREDKEVYFEFHDIKTKVEALKLARQIINNLLRTIAVL